jgi:hypothetical protein
MLRAEAEKKRKRDELVAAEVTLSYYCVARKKLGATLEVKVA